MAISPTYPGVYIQEIDSGVRTVAGVPTSIAAFVGRTKKGAVNDPTPCFNMGEFQDCRQYIHILHQRLGFGVPGFQIDVTDN